MLQVFRKGRDIALLWVGYFEGRVAIFVVWEVPIFALIVSNFVGDEFDYTRRFGRASVVLYAAPIRSA